MVKHKGFEVSCTSTSFSSKTPEVSCTNKIPEVEQGSCVVEAEHFGLKFQCPKVLFSSFPSFDALCIPIGHHHLLGACVGSEVMIQAVVLLVTVISLECTGDMALTSQVIG